MQQEERSSRLTTPVNNGTANKFNCSNKLFKNTNFDDCISNLFCFCSDEDGDGVLLGLSGLLISIVQRSKSRI